MALFQQFDGLWREMKGSGRAGKAARPAHKDLMTITIYHLF